MIFNPKKSFGAMLCALLVYAQGMAVAEDPQEFDLFKYYAAHIHRNGSGVYEGEGWVFFHDRVTLPSKDRFAKARATGIAMKTATKNVFAWIDEHGGARPNALNVSHDWMRKLGVTFGNEATRPRRTLAGLPMRVLCRDVDEEKSDVFVFDMAARRRDLIVEAEKGSFETRHDVVAAQWRTVVREQLLGTNRMAFVRSVGAFDLWTLDSELTSGVIEVVMTNGQEIACCERCVDELDNCVRKVKTAASGEYGRFLDEFKRDIAKEATDDFLSCRTNQVGMMMYSYASCLCQLQELPDDAYDVIGRLAAQTDPLDATVRAMLPVMNRVPACKDCWRVLGETFLRFGKCHAAMSCFRNAIRLGRDDAEVFDLMAVAYEKMGFGELSKGAAMVAYGLSKAEDKLSESRRILGVSE